MSPVGTALFLASPLALLCGWCACGHIAANLNFIPTTAGARVALRKDAAARDETAFYNPAQGLKAKSAGNPY